MLSPRLVGHRLVGHRQPTAIVTDGRWAVCIFMTNLNHNTHTETRALPILTLCLQTNDSKTEMRITKLHKCAKHAKLATVMQEKHKHIKSRSEQKENKKLEATMETTQETCNQQMAKGPNTDDQKKSKMNND